MSAEVKNQGATIGEKGVSLVNNSKKPGKLKNHTVAKETSSKSLIPSMVGLAALTGVATIFGFLIGGAPLAAITFTATLGLEGFYFKLKNAKTNEKQ